MNEEEQVPAFYDYGTDSDDDTGVPWYYVNHAPTSAAAAQWEPITGDALITLNKPNNLHGWTVDVDGDVSPTALREALDLAETIMQESE